MHNEMHDAFHLVKNVQNFFLAILYFADEMLLQSSNIGNSRPKLQSYHYCKLRLVRTGAILSYADEIFPQF